MTGEACRYQGLRQKLYFDGLVAGELAATLGELLMNHSEMGPDSSRVRTAELERLSVPNQRGAALTLWTLYVVRTVLAYSYLQSLQNPAYLTLGMIFRF